MVIITNTKYICPECHSDGGFEVEAETPATFTVDGTGDIIDVEPHGGYGEWFDTDSAKCCDCGHEAPAGHFRVRTEHLTDVPMVIEEKL